MRRVLWLWGGFCLGGLVLGVVPTLAGEPPVAEVRREAVRAGFLVREVRHLEVALQTGADMLDGEGLAADEIEVVVCGGAVEALRQDSALEARLAEASRRGIRVAACGVTLAKKGIDPAELSPGVSVVDNGLVEILRLQSEGWRTVEL